VKTDVEIHIQHRFLNVLMTLVLAKTDVESAFTTSVLAITDVVNALSTSVLDQPMLFFCKFLKYFICFYNEPTISNLQKLY